jgi:signal peptidase I
MKENELEFDSETLQRIDEINGFKRKLSWKVPLVVLLVLGHEVLKMIDPYKDFNPTQSTLFEVILIITVFVGLSYWLFNRTTDSIEYEKPFVHTLYKIWHSMVDYLMIIPVLVFIVTVTNMFFFSFSPISGTSMAPNLSDEEAVIFSHIYDELERFDVVIVYEDSLNEPYLIKRVIGLPGETITIENGRVYVDGSLLDEPLIDASIVETLCVQNGDETCTFDVEMDAYFVLGDNRNGQALSAQPSGYSIDSRTFGTVTKTDIYGRVVFQFKDYNILD